YPRFPGLTDTCESLEAWVSIGYPYDVVRAGLPDYFRGREPQAFHVGQWFNVAGFDDFLGSKFRDDHLPAAPDPRFRIFSKGGQASPTRNVYFPRTDEETPVGWRRRDWKDRLNPLRRLINHFLYWDNYDALGPSCFTGLFEAGYLKELIETVRRLQD